MYIHPSSHLILSKTAVKLQKCSRESMLSQAVEILVALRQLGEEVRQFSIF